MSRRALLSLLVILVVSNKTYAASEPSPKNACFENVAQTDRYSLGIPLHFEPLPDGRSVLYLRSGPRDRKLGLFQLDLASRQEHELAAPGNTPENISVEEKARRERARMILSGITDYELSRDGQTVLVSEADQLAVVSLVDGHVQPLPESGWIAPHMSPDGHFVAAVRDNDLHVVDLQTGVDRQITSGGIDTLTHGLPEFAASEELGRADGTWWSPDGRTVLYEESDTSGVEQHWIADPNHPERPPTEFRYPRAGTANAKVRLGLVERDGSSTRWIDWDTTNFPYLVRVVWPEGSGPLTLVVMNRAQTEQRLLAVDTASGHATTILQETDPAWINASPGINWRTAPLPRWLPDGSGFFWANDRDGPWRLELRHADGKLDHVMTPPNLSFLSLDDVDVGARTVTILAAPDSTDSAVYRIPIKGGEPLAIAAEEGQHAVVFNQGGHSIFVDQLQGADGSEKTLVREASGHVVGTLPAHAEKPPVLHVTFTKAGPRKFDAAVIRPSNFIPGRRYPVVLAVYGGPAVKLVQHTPRSFIRSQCVADQGFIVVSLDGRGTPSRGHDWERAIHGDLIDVPLHDQIEGLQALAQRFPEIDMSRVGITGWSFGGYLTAMATIRRPDVFHVGVAGATPSDEADYDTIYTERYLGTPQDNPDGYKKSNVLTYAAGLSRPLLLIHGMADDNVYFVNTVKLTEALLSAGRTYDLILLPGTHSPSDQALTERVDEAAVQYLRSHLVSAPQH